MYDKPVNRGTSPERNIRTMMRKEPRSNFARMDEMEEKENLQSKKTLFESRCPWHYHGRFFRLLRKLHLGPMLFLGLVMIIVGEILLRVLGFAVLGMHFLGLGVIIALFGLAELAFIRRDEND